MKEKLAHSLPFRIVGRYGAANGGMWAQVVAWNAFFALFPMVLVTVTLVGLLLHDPGIARTIEGGVANAVGGGTATTDIQKAFDSFKHNTGILAVVGVVSLMWSGSALVGAFDQAINALYPAPPRSFVAQKIMSVGVMLLFTVFTIPLVLSSALLPALKDIPGIPEFLLNGTGTILLHSLLGVAAGTALFAVIYYVVPNHPQKWRRILPGSIIGGILLEVITLLFPAYVSLSRGFTTYGHQFALLFLLLTYLFLLGQVVVIGATINAELDPDPARNAAAIESNPVLEEDKRRSRQATSPAAPRPAAHRAPRQGRGSGQSSPRLGSRLGPLLAATVALAVGLVSFRHRPPR